MVDVTLSAAGQRIHAHRIVLCACSTLFQVNLPTRNSNSFDISHDILICVC
jgi:hypothetical protein